jgi:hypothetical protein
VASAAISTADSWYGGPVMREAIELFIPSSLVEIIICYIKFEKYPNCSCRFKCIVNTKHLAWSTPVLNKYIFIFICLK